MSKGRGRPRKYTGNVARHIAGLVNKLTAVHAREALNAGPKNSLRTMRNLKCVPKALGISMPTVLKIAAEHKVVLHPGRPAKAA